MNPSGAGPRSDLRRQVERLDGLPLRPGRARLLDEAGGPDSDADDPYDPGWVLGRWAGHAPWDLLATRPLWARGSADAAEALGHLWCHAVATATAARRLAEEAGLDRPDELARVGLLCNLGAWAVAAVDPECLAIWRTLRGRDDRLAWERDRVGTAWSELGRERARAWIADPSLSEAIGLAAMPAATIDACATEPERVQVIREALAWVEATPWALQRDESAPAADHLRNPRVAWLVTEVQAACATPLLDHDGGPDRGAIVRQAARLRIENEALRRELTRRDAVLRHCLESAPDPTPPQGIDRAARDLPAEALARLDAWKDRWDRLTREFEGLAWSHRRLADRFDDEVQRRCREGLAEFAAGAGHELNNPLAVILGRGQLLLARQPDPEAVRSLRAIIAQARRAHRILRDLMYVGRTPEPRPRPCQPESILKGCVADLQAEAEARGVTLLCQARESSGLVQLDPDGLRQLAEALIRNGLEATPRGGTVRATAQPDDGALDWRFADTGQGIDDLEGPRLFDPFYCGRQAGRGLGLGLPRAARFVGRAGGTIRWTSHPGQGTTFHVRLPMRRHEPTDAGRP